MCVLLDFSFIIILMVLQDKNYKDIQNPRLFSWLLWFYKLTWTTASSVELWHPYQL